MPDGVDPVLWNREQKIMQAPKAGVWSLYLDGSLSPKGPVRDSVEKWLEHHEVAMFKHPWRTCAYDEIDECVARGKLEADAAERCRAHLRLAGFPRHFGLWACGMIARRSFSNAFQNYIAPMWWHYVQEAPRDQIWLPFMVWKIRGTLARIYTVEKNIYDNKLFAFRRHGK